MRSIHRSYIAVMSLHAILLSQTFAYAADTRSVTKDGCTATMIQAPSYMPGTGGVFSFSGEGTGDLACRGSVGSGLPLGDGEVVRSKDDYGPVYGDNKRDMTSRLTMRVPRRPQGNTCYSARRLTAFMAFGNASEGRVYIQGADCPASLSSLNFKTVFGTAWKQGGTNDWAGDALCGSANHSVGSFGCAMTSVAMLLSSVGVTKLPTEDEDILDPGTLNDWLTDNTGSGSTSLCTNSANIKWGNTIEQGSGQRFKWKPLNNGYVPYANLKEKLKAILQDGYPVVIGVKQKPNGAPGHYIVVQGVSGNDFIIQNPGAGNNSLNDYLSVHGDWIYLKGTIEAIEPDSDFEIETKLTSTFAYDKSYLTIGVSDQDEVLVTDPMGRRVGYDSVTHSKVVEIPGSDWTIDSIDPDDDSFSNPNSYYEIYIDRPIAGNYTITVSNSKGNGQYDLAVSAAGRSGLRSKFQTYTGIGPAGQTQSFVFNNDTVASAPTAQDDIFLIKQDQSLIVSSLNSVLNNDSRISLGSMTAKAVTNPAHGRLSFASNGAFNYIPEPGYVGTDSFMYSVQQSGYSDSAPARVQISIAPLNHAPTFKLGPNQIVSSNSGSQVVQGWATQISTGDRADSGQLVSFTVTNDSPSLFDIQPYLTSNGDLFYAPKPGVNGAAHLIVKLSDNGGTSNDGCNESEEQEFTITLVNTAESSWSGSGSSNSWSDSSNWTSGIVPIGENSDVLRFGNSLSSGTSIDLSGDRIAHSIKLESTSNLTIGLSGSETLSLYSGVLKATQGAEYSFGSVISSQFGISFQGISYSSLISGTRYLVNSVNTSNRAIRVNNSILRLGTDWTTGAGYPLSNYGALDLNGHSILLSSLSGSGIITNSSTSSSTMLINTAEDLSYSGSIGNSIPNNGPAINLIKEGPATLILAGNLYHTGNTEVKGGKLVVQSLPPSSSVKVTSSAFGKGVLVASGNVGGIQSVTGTQGGGVISIGSLDWPGSLNSSSVDISDDGTIRMRVGNQMSSDFLQVQGALTIGSTSKLKLDLAGLNRTGTLYGIITAGSISGAFDPSNISTENNPAGFTVGLVYHSNSIDILISQ